jgi:SAM-dependent methyltransferase
VRRLNGWFRGIRVHRNEWDRRYSRVRDQVPPLEPSPLARFVAEEVSQGPGQHVVDGGCGRGGDALWFARQGTSTVGLDYSWSAARAARRVAEQEGLDLRLDWMNLHELRSVLAHGARIARLEGPVTLMAHHLVDSTDTQGLQALARLARMSLSGGGRLYADFDALRPGETYRPGGPRDAIRPQDVDEVVAVLEESGAEVVQCSVQEPESDGPGGPDGPDGLGRPVARVVAQWSSRGSPHGGRKWSRSERVVQVSDERSFRDRAVERVARAVAGDRLDQLQRRLEDLEAEVQECRQLNVRLAEVTDLVEQLLLPAAVRDEERFAAAVEKYTRTL